MTLFALLVGLALLVGGGELLVRGATSLALLVRIPAAVIGVTIVAMGTSMPELVVSLLAAFDGTPDLATGNVIGSNIYNIALILGVAGLIRPLRAGADTIRLEVPVVLLAACLLLALGRDGLLDRGDGAFLVLALVTFVAWTVRRAVKEASRRERELLAQGVAEEVVTGSRPVALLITLVGMLLLTGGARLFLVGAVDLAQGIGLSERVIGLTIVALATSLPELFASAAASFKGQDDLAISNVTGSNIFNILGILGVTAVVHPIRVHPAMLSSDGLWMIGLSALLFPLIWRGHLGRGKAGLLLALAVGYTVLLLRGP